MYQASDRATDPALRRTATTTLLVRLEDSDDQDPEFSQPEYRARVVGGVVAGVLDLQPDSLTAQDRDSIRSQIQYRSVLLF